MECGDCTLCCLLLPVPEIKKPANILCKYCDGQCSIYDRRPEECKLFNCVYKQMDKAFINLRPDKCKVIFEKMTGNIIHGTLHPDYDIKDIVKKQINMFLEEGYSVIIESLQFKNLHIYPTKNILSLDVYKEFKKKVEEKYKWQ